MSRASFSSTASDNLRWAPTLRREIQLLVPMSLAMDLQKKLLREPPPRALTGDLTPRNKAEQSTEMALGG
eukprot:3458199-Pyramimonas_sp.AAC.1